MASLAKFWRPWWFLILLLSAQTVWAINSNSHTPNDYISPQSPKKILLITTFGDWFTIVKYQPFMHGYIYQVQPIDKILTRQVLASLKNRGNHVRAINLPTHNFLNSTEMTPYWGSDLTKEGQGYLAQLTRGMDVDVILLVLPETPGKPEAWTGFSPFSIDIQGEKAKFIMRYQLLQIDAHDYHVANMEKYTLVVKLPSSEIEPSELSNILYSMNERIAYSIMRVFESMESTLGVAYGLIPVNELQTPE